MNLRRVISSVLRCGLQEVFSQYSYSLYPKRIAVCSSSNVQTLTLFSIHLSLLSLLPLPVLSILLYPRKRTLQWSGISGRADQRCKQMINVAVPPCWRRTVVPAQLTSGGTSSFYFILFSICSPTRDSFVSTWIETNILVISFSESFT